MSAAIIYNKLNLSNRFGNLACALALLPMLLWPSLSRGECCCADLAGQIQAAPSDTMLPELVGSSTSGVQPQTLKLEVSARCPHCTISSQADVADYFPVSATLKPLCDCQAHLLASFISSRAESSTTDLRTVAVDGLFTAISTASDKPTPAMGNDAQVHLLSPTGNQRRALLCCWLN